MKISTIPVAAICILLTGCASLTPVSLSVYNHSKTVSMTANINKEYTVVKHVTVEQKSPLLFLQRLFPQVGSRVNIDDLLQPEFQATKGDAIVNVKIIGSTKVGDFVLPIVLGIGGGIAFPPFYFFTILPLFEDLKTYSVEGDIVQYTGSTIPPEKSKGPIDPLTGVPVKDKKVKYDPETGLPLRE